MSKPALQHIRVCINIIYIYYVVSVLISICSCSLCVVVFDYAWIYFCVCVPPPHCSTPLSPARFQIDDFIHTAFLRNGRHKILRVSMWRDTWLCELGTRFASCDKRAGRWRRTETAQACVSITRKLTILTQCCGPVCKATNYNTIQVREGLVRRFCINAHLTERVEVVVVCP